MGLLLTTERLLIEEVRCAFSGIAGELMVVFNSNEEFHGQSGDPLVWSAEDIQEYLRGVSNPDFPNLESRQLTIRLADSGEVIGTVQLIAPLMQPESDTHWISFLIFSRQQQRLGFGQEVVEALESALASEGWEEIRVFVHRDTLSAHRFWLGRGYNFVENATNRLGKPGTVLAKRLFE